VGLDVDFVIVGCARPDVADALLATDAFLLEGGGNVGVRSQRDR